MPSTTEVEKEEEEEFFAEWDEHAQGLRKLSAVLDEAKRLVCNDRREEYGGVNESFNDIARMWSVLFGQDVTPEQVALAMVLLKVCREKRVHKRDNLVDVAGYAALADFIACAK